MTRTTRIDLGPGGRESSDGALAVRWLRPEVPGRARVALVATQALLLDGDQVTVEVRISGDHSLEIVETAGMVAHDMRGGCASYAIAITLLDRSTLHWAAQPFVVADGASVLRTLTAELGSAARATLKESMVLGRTGERGGAIEARTSVTHAGSPLVKENLHLDGDWRYSSPIHLDGGKRMDTLMWLGHREFEHPGVVQLEGPGSWVRWIGDGPSPLERQPPAIASR